VVWEGVVYGFDLKGASHGLAYACSSPIVGSDTFRFFAVLDQGPVKSPVDAVSAAIVAEQPSGGYGPSHIAVLIIWRLCCLGMSVQIAEMENELPSLVRKKVENSIRTLSCYVQILPDGQISEGLCVCPVQPHLQKYFCFSEPKSLL
jgi:hypothetical protein